MSVVVATTKDGGHPPEFWARAATNKIISVSETADPVLRKQAQEFRDLIETPICNAMKNAIKSDRSTLVAKLEQRGQHAFANELRSL